jgi:hypothetical protein
MTVPLLGQISTMSLWAVYSLGGFSRFGTAPVSGAWTTANKALFWPFILPVEFFLGTLWWLNGGTSNGNVDMGIYDDRFHRVISTGSTAQGTINVVQSVAVGPVLLLPGNYYFALALSSATATIFGLSGSLSNVSNTDYQGIFEQATAFPLPDPAVPAKCSSIFGLDLCGAWEAGVY